MATPPEPTTTTDSTTSALAPSDPSPVDQSASTEPPHTKPTLESDASDRISAAKAELFKRVFGSADDSDSDLSLNLDNADLDDSDREHELVARHSRRKSVQTLSKKEKEKEKDGPDLARLSNLFNPFRLLEHSPADGAFGVSFLQNGLNGNSVVRAAAEAQRAWEDVRRDWRELGIAAKVVGDSLALPKQQQHKTPLLSSASFTSLHPLSLSAAASSAAPALSHDNCATCFGRGELLCCDSCPLVFHFCCVEEGFSEGGVDVPPVWYCKKCRWKH
ncbi:hypothetical protein HDU99_003406, partial [Rhizoclosmatium hyalinum]